MTTVGDVMFSDPRLQVEVRPNPIWQGPEGVHLPTWESHPGWLTIGSRSFPMPALMEPPFLTPKEVFR